MEQVPEHENLTETLGKRIQCLEGIVHRPADKRMLSEVLDMPRSTLDDVVRELEKHDLVEYESGEWRPTTLGRMTYHVYYDYLQNIDDIVSAQPLLKHVSSDDNLCWEFLIGAVVQEGHPNVCGSLMTTMLEYLKDATEIHFVTPNFVAGYYEEMYRNCTMGTDPEIELITSQSVYRWLSETYPSRTQTMVQSEHIEIFTAAIPLSFGIAILDNETVLCSIVADQDVAGLIINDTDDALGWARNQYAYVRNEAQPIALKDE